jgi:hypothetical protein
MTTTSKTMTPVAPRKNSNDGSGITALPGFLAFAIGPERWENRFVPKKRAHQENSKDGSGSMLRRLRFCSRSTAVLRRDLDEMIQGTAGRYCSIGERIARTRSEVWDQSWNKGSGKCVVPSVTKNGGDYASYSVVFGRSDCCGYRLDAYTRYLKGRIPRQ